MFAKERQNQIYELLQENNAVTTANLVDRFQVSIETIRRDLLDMEKQGLLLRVHGGAVTRNDMRPFPKLPERNLEHSAQKRDLSQKAAEFITEGDIIGIDSGSTAISFAEVLKEKFTKLTIVTHSLDAFHILSKHADFSVILCGGHYLQSENAFYGPLALSTLRALHISKAFIFPSAVSLKYGIFDYQNELYQMQRQLLESSDNVFILADSSKFEKKALLKLDDMKSDYFYITDSDFPKEMEKLYKQNQIKIYKRG